MSNGNKILWLPILTELGEDVVARLIDKSPDVKSAILEAKENFDKAVEEGEALKNKGHKPPDVVDE